MCVCVREHVRVRVHVRVEHVRVHVRVRRWSMRMCVCVCVHVRVHVHVRWRVRLRVRVLVRVCVCACARACACVRVCLLIAHHVVFACLCVCVWLRQAGHHDSELGGAASSSGPSAPLAALGVSAGGPDPSAEDQQAGKGIGKGSRDAWHAWQSFDVHADDGTYQGCIKHGSKDGILSAHCLYTSPGHDCNDHGLCRVNRTCGEAKNKQGGQGRPLGFLVAWLRSAIHYACRGDHYDMRKYITLQERQDARQWVESSAIMAIPRSKERHPRAGEGLEPVNINQN